MELKLFRWPIRAQLVVIFLIVGLVFSAGAGKYIKSIEINQVHEHAKSKSNQASAFMMDYFSNLIVKNDFEKLDEEIGDYVRNAKDLFVVEVYDNENEEIVNWRSKLPISKEYCLEFEHTIKLENSNFYLIKLKWNYKASLLKLENELWKKQATIFVISMLGFIFLLGVMHVLVTRPLKHIHGKLSNAAIGDDQKAISVSSRAKEFQDLDETLNSLLLLSKEQNSREQTVRAVIDVSMDCIIIADQAGRIVEFNPAAERTFGYKQEEVIGRLLTDTIIPEEYRDAHKEGMKKYLEDGLAKVIGQRIEVPALHATGAIFPVELVIEAVDSDSGKIFVAYLRDITDRKNYEKRLEEQIQRAEAANAAKSEFLAMMSHEIRTPLNGVIGVLGLLNETEMTSDQKKYVRTGRHSAETLLNVINDVLDFSKMEAGKLELESEVFDIHTLIESVADIIRPRGTAKEINLFVDIASDVPQWIEGDSGRIRQVLLNLAGNAIKFTKVGHVSISLEREKGYLLFNIEDTGIGIPKNKHGELFTEFAMLDSSYSRKFGGTGLGLSISKKLAELMDGKLSFESEEGQGSTFQMKLPFTVSEVPLDLEDLGEEAKSIIVNYSSQRVLVAEDNAANVIVIKAILERLGLVVDVASNGEEAVEAVRHFPYDLIFMDIAMPEMDGMEATNLIRHLSVLPSGNIGTTLPIVAMTAHAMSGYRQKVLDAGMDDYLRKPINRNRLMATLNRYLKTTSDPITKKEEDTTILSSNEKDGMQVCEWDGYLILDKEIVKRLEGDIGEDEIHILADVYFSDSLKRMGRIKEALAAYDYQVIEDEAHTLGSSSAAYGLTALHKCLRIIEGALLDGEKEMAINFTNQSITLYEKSIKHLRNYLDTLFIKKI